jgi:CHAT domain-containing protein
MMRGGKVRLRSAPKTRGVGQAELAKLPRLPDTGEEVVSVAKALKANLNRDVFLGTRATEKAVKQANLSDYKVVHFATHGLIPLDLNGLTQPALALSSPKLTSGTREDGLLTMGEILTLQLDADWVVLSACNTAAGEEGGEAFSGLGRAFFYAGTRAILLSNWPVETTSARALTTDLFKRQAEHTILSRSQALQAAMLGLIDGPGYIDPESNKVVFSYAHPIFWAPFSLVGDGGGGKPAIN